jgi:hypothetical protein
MDIVRSVTQHPVVQKPLLNLIGQECFITIFDRGDFSSKFCLKLVAQKGLNLGLVLGGGIVKIPQSALAVTAQRL